jgi:hypothetical protein
MSLTIFYSELAFYELTAVDNEQLVYLLPDKRVQPYTASTARQPLPWDYAAHLRVAALLALFHLNP